MPENQHKDNGVLPSTAGNKTLHLPRAEINPYYPSFNIYSNLNAQVNPIFPDDFPLESEFSRLNLSAPCNPFPSTEPLAYGGSVLEKNSLVDLPMAVGFAPAPYGQAQLPNGDFQRMRIQSAVRGQMGLYMQPQNYSLVGEGLDAISGLNSREIFKYDLHNGGLNLNGETIRYPTRPPSHLPYETGYGNPPNMNRNGFKLDTSKFQDRGASMGGIEANNSGILMSRFRSNFSSLENLRGKLFMEAKDQYGCRSLQKKLEGGNPEEIQFIFSELKEHVRELMVDQFGNYLMQKFFEICNEQQMNQLLLLVISDDRALLAICLDMHGYECRFLSQTQVMFDMKYLI